MTAGMADLGWNTQPEPRRRRRWPRNLVIVLLVLAGLLTAADRIAVGIAENAIASRIQSSQNLPEKPSVSIDGFPFLTQLLAKDLKNVTVDARGFQRNGVRVTDFRADLHFVTPTPGYKGATVGHLDATAFMNFTDLAAAIEANVPAAQNITVSDGGDGALKISGSLGSVSSVLQIGPGNRISAHATKVITGFGGGISLPLDYNAVIPIPLPLNAQLHDFQVAADGVRIAATADGITITSSGIQ